MSPFVESIKAEKGILFNMDYHNQRFNQTRLEAFGIEEKLDLRSVIPAEKSMSGLFKCRVIYLAEIIETIFEPYQMKKINTLKLVYDDNIDYHLKSTDRKDLQLLYEQRESCDDIIIIKHGFVTDSFSANLIFNNGNEWHTPSKPLLEGTKREKLLREGKIKSKIIRVDDISDYQKVGLINAMIEPGEILMPVENIHK